MRRRFAAAAALLCLAGAARAQEPKETIEPDRPDITNGTHIVDIGILQIEVGGLYTRPAAGQHTLSGTDISICIRAILNRFLLSSI